MNERDVFPIPRSSFIVPTSSFPPYDPSALASGKLHIFTAIRAEASAIRPVLPAGVELTIIGIGATRLSRQQIEARAIIMAGFAGALDPTLRIGDIVRDDPPGTIHTSTELIATAQAKAKLFVQTGARAVDMENRIVREFAGHRGIPFIGLRAISDAADEAVDPIVLSFIDDTGRLRPAAIAKGLILRPTIIPSLTRLRRNTAIAGHALAEAVRLLLKENRALFE